MRRRQISDFVWFGLMTAFGILGAATASGSKLAVSHGWMQFIIPSRPAAGYFTLRNESGATRVLVAASSPACGRLVLHQSQESGGSARMVVLNSVAIPPYQTIKFEPGSYHLMCMAPASFLRPGARAMVTLHFMNGEKLRVPFAVRGIQS